MAVASELLIGKTEVEYTQQKVHFVVLFSPVLFVTPQGVHFVG
jgi:hypothetical protein